MLKISTNEASLEENTSQETSSSGSLARPRLARGSRLESKAEAFISHTSEADLQDCMVYKEVIERNYPIDQRLVDTNDSKVEISSRKSLDPFIFDPKAQVQIENVSYDRVPIDLSKVPSSDFSTFVPLIGPKYFCCGTESLKEVVNAIETLLRTNNADLPMIEYEVETNRYSWQGSVMCPEGTSTQFTISLYHDIALSKLILKFHRIAGCCNMFAKILERFANVEGVPDLIRCLCPKSKEERQFTSHGGHFHSISFASTKPTSDRMTASCESFTKDCELFVKWIESDPNEALSCLIKIISKLMQEYDLIIIDLSTTASTVSSSNSALENVNRAIISLFITLCRILVSCWSAARNNGIIQYDDDKSSSTTYSKRSKSNPLGLGGSHVSEVTDVDVSGIEVSLEQIEIGNATPAVSVSFRSAGIMGRDEPSIHHDSNYVSESQSFQIDSQFTHYSYEELFSTMCKTLVCLRYVFRPSEAHTSSRQRIQQVLTSDVLFKEHLQSIKQYLDLCDKDCKRFVGNKRSHEYRSFRSREFQNHINLLQNLIEA